MNNASGIDVIRDILRATAGIAKARVIAIHKELPERKAVFRGVLASAPPELIEQLEPMFVKLTDSTTAEVCDELDSLANVLETIAADEQPLKRMHEILERATTMA